MPGLCMLSRISLEDKSSDHRDIPELPPGHLRTVDAALYVRRQVFRTEELIGICVIQRDGLVTQQLKTIIIHRERKADGCSPADPVSQQRRHRLMHQSSLKRIYKQVESILCLY